MDGQEWGGGGGHWERDALARQLHNDNERARWRGADDAAMRIAVIVAVPLLLVLLAGHLSALAVNGGVPHYPLREAPTIVGRAIAHPADPGRAWDGYGGARVPGPVAWWATYAALLAVTGLLVWLGVRRNSRRPTEVTAAEPADDGPRWGETPQLRIVKGDPHRVVVGTSGGKRVAISERHSLLVVGSAHAGKTAAVAVPALLEWRGPAVVAASKGHLLDDTVGWRSRQGDVLVYDPAAVGRYALSGWSPLVECGTWSGALRIARDLTASASATGLAVDVRQHSSMATALAPFLLAAAASGRSIVDAASWIERGERDEVLDVLRSVDRDAARAHEATFLRSDDVRAGFFHTMYETLSVYEDPVVAGSASRHEIVPDELLDGGHHTLYLTAPEHDQRRFRPLCATVVRQVLAAAYERSSAAGEPLDPPLLLILDDAVGVAPIGDLAALASTGASRGVQIVSVFQDLAQLRRHYGDTSDLVVKNHRARLVLPTGYYPDAEDEDQLVPAALRQQLGDGEAALVYGPAAPARVRLRPWFEDKELRRRAETPQDALPAAPRPSAAAAGRNLVRFNYPGSYSAVEQGKAWMGRGQTSAAPAEAVPPADPAGPAGPADPDEDDTIPGNVTVLPWAEERFRRM